MLGLAASAIKVFFNFNKNSDLSLDSAVSAATKSSISTILIVAIYTGLTYLKWTKALTALQIVSSIIIFLFMFLFFWLFHFTTSYQVLKKRF